MLNSHRGSLDTVSLLLGMLTLMITSWGCSAPAKLYVLSPHLVPREAAIKQGLIIGVGPISLPGELDRPQLVTRAASKDGEVSNSLRAWEDHRWAHRIDKHFATTLAENLASLLGAEKIVQYPWGRGAKVDYQVEVDVRRFDASLGEESVLEARWRLLGPKDEELYRPEPAIFRVATPIDGTQLYAAVGGLSESLVGLSREVATHIVEQEAQRLAATLAQGEPLPATGKGDGTTRPASFKDDLRMRLGRLERLQERLREEIEDLRELLQQSDGEN